MKNLNEFGVKEMSAQEAMKIEGGSWFSKNWWKIGLMILCGFGAYNSNM